MPPLHRVPLLLTLLLPLLMPGQAWGFTDVTSDRWGYESIEILSSAAITSGCDSENFCPDNTLQRAEMAIFLLRSQYGSDYAPSTATGTVFDDVAADYWAGSFVERLSELGITSGCTATEFCPSREITRGEMAIFLLRTKYGSDYQPPSSTGAVFGDISADYWAASFIEQLSAEGLTDDTFDTTRECDEGHFCPSLTINRAEMAVFLVRTFELTADDDSGSGTQTGEMALTSSAIEDGEILDDYKCEQKVDDIEDSIPLAWSGVPDSAGSLAITMHHYPNSEDTTQANAYLLLWDIDPSVTEIAHGGADDGAWYMGSNKDGTAISYTSPCSPSAGSHEYILTLYALSETPASLPSYSTLDVTYDVLLEAIESVTVIETTTLTFEDVTE
ncbi:MAG: S-layer homology domain-containing protein [Magnetococcales bacterium]|nr:S-layer homology domain-containing protein [Magnetococcales bacterium]